MIDLAPITVQDRLDAVENIAIALDKYGSEIDVLEALDVHELLYDQSRNLGYYRTFIECSCGTGWWFGGHDGDPAASDRWNIHRAEVLRAAQVDGSAQ